MKVRTLSASQFSEDLVKVSIEEPQTKAVITVWLTLEEVQRVTQGFLAIARSMEHDQRVARVVAGE